MKDLKFSTEDADEILRNAKAWEKYLKERDDYEPGSAVDDPGFWSGLHRTIGQVIKGAGDVVPGDAVSAYGEEMIRQNPAPTEGIMDGSTAGIRDVMGQGIGYVGLPIAAAYAGAPTALSGALSFLLAQAGSYGAMRQEQDDLGIEDEKMRAFMSSLPIAAIEMGGLQRAVPGLSTALRKQMIEAFKAAPSKEAKEALIKDGLAKGLLRKEGAKALLKEAGIIGGQELGEEFLQQPFEYSGVYGADQLLTDEGQSDLADSYKQLLRMSPDIFLGAGLMGGGMGALKQTDKQQEKLYDQAIGEHQGYLDKLKRDKEAADKLAAEEAAWGTVAPSDFASLEDIFTGTPEEQLRNIRGAFGEMNPENQQARLNLWETAAERGTLENLSQRGAEALPLGRAKDRQLLDAIQQSTAATPEQKQLAKDLAQQYGKTNIQQLDAKAIEKLQKQIAKLAKDTGTQVEALPDIKETIAEALEDAKAAFPDNPAKQMAAVRERVKDWAGETQVTKKGLARKLEDAILKGDEAVFEQAASSIFREPPPKQGEAKRQYTQELSFLRQSLMNGMTQRTQQQFADIINPDNADIDLNEISESEAAAKLSDVLARFASKDYQAELRTPERMLFDFGAVSSALGNPESFNALNNSDLLESAVEAAKQGKFQEILKEGAKRRRTGKGTASVRKNRVAKVNELITQLKDKGLEPELVAQMEEQVGLIESNPKHSIQPTTKMMTKARKALQGATTKKNKTAEEIAAEARAFAAQSPMTEVAEGQRVVYDDQSRANLNKRVDEQIGKSKGSDLRNKVKEIRDRLKAAKTKDERNAIYRELEYLADVGASETQTYFGSVEEDVKPREKPKKAAKPVKVTKLFENEAKLLAKNLVEIRKSMKSVHIKDRNLTATKEDATELVLWLERNGSQVAKDLAARIKKAPSLQSKSVDEVGSTPEEFLSAVETTFGKVRGDALHVAKNQEEVFEMFADVNGVTLEQAKEQVPEMSAAFIDPMTGDIYIQADRVSPENATGVMIHEAMHKALRSDPDLIPEYEKFIQRAQKLLEGPSVVAQSARNKIKRHGETDAEEKAGYLIEAAQQNWEQTPNNIRWFIDELLSAVKVWANKITGGKLFKIENMSINDLRYLVSTKISRAGSKAEMVQPKGVLKDAVKMLSSMADVIAADTVSVDTANREAVNKIYEGNEAETGAMTGEHGKLIYHSTLKHAREFVTSEARKLGMKLVTPMHNTMDKNPFGRMVKYYMTELDSLAQSILTNASEQMDSLLTRSEKLADYSKYARIISDHLIQHNLVNPKLNEAELTRFSKLTPHIDALASQSIDNKLMEKLLSLNPEDLKDLPDEFIAAREAILKYIDESYNKMMALQPGFDNGELVLQGHRKVDGKWVEMEKETLNFDPKDAAEAKESIYTLYSAVARAAIGREVSRAASYNMEKLTDLHALAKGVEMEFDAATRDRLVTLVDAYTAVNLKDANKGTKFLKDFADTINALEDGESLSTSDFNNSAILPSHVKSINQLIKGMNAKQREEFTRGFRSSALNMQLRATMRQANLNQAFHTINNFYITHQRQKKYLVIATMRNGTEKVETDPERYSHVVMEFDTKEDADKAAADYNKEMEGRQFTVEDVENETQKVTMRADVQVRDFKHEIPSTSGDHPLNEMIRIFREAKTDINPEQMEKVARYLNTTMERKKALSYKAAMGVDRTTTMQAIASYLNASAYIVASNYYSHKINRILEMKDWSAGAVQKEIDLIEERLKFIEGPDRAALKEELRSLQEDLELATQFAGEANNIHDLTNNVVHEYRQQIGSTTMLRNAMRFTTVAMLGGNISTAIGQVMSLPVTVPAYLGAMLGDGKLGYTMHVERVLFRNLAELAKTPIFRTLTKTPVHQAEAKVAAMSDSDPTKPFWKHVASEMKEGRLQLGQVLSVTATAHEGVKPSGVYTRKFMDKYMLPFALSEAYIRVATFKTGFDLSQEQGHSFQKSVDWGNKAVENTQGVYNHWARAPWLQKSWVRPFTMFIHYPQVQVALIWNLLNNHGAAGKRGAAFYIAALFMMAGADGFPLADDMKRLADLLLNTFPSLKKYFPGGVSGFIRENLKEIEDDLSDFTGLEMREVLNKGMLSWLLGTDFSMKLGMAKVTPGGTTFADYFGPLGSVASGTVNTLTAASKGDLEQMMLALPVSAVRNAYKGATMMSSGQYKSKQGFLVTEDLSPLDAAKMFIGFTPLQVGTEYADNNIIYSINDMHRTLTKNLNTEAARMLINKDYKGYRKLKKEMDESNRLYKKMGIKLKLTWNPKQHREKVKAMTKPLTKRTLDKSAKYIQRAYYGSVYDN